MGQECPNNSSDTAATRQTLPPVQCAPWCQDGHGHTDAFHPADQYCMSAEERVMLGLDRYEAIEYGDGDMRQDWMGVYVTRENGAPAGEVRLIHNEVSEMTYAASEAVKIGFALIRAGMMAEVPRGYSVAELIEEGRKGFFYGLEEGQRVASHVPAARA